MRAEIARLATANGVQAKTLESIAKLIGLRRPGLTQDQLLVAVRDKAAKVAELQGVIGLLRTQVETLDDARERAVAESAVSRAEKSLAEGRLQDVGKDLDELGDPGGSTKQADAIWLNTVEAQAKNAELQLDYNGATEIRLLALRQIRGTSGDRFQLAMAAAEAQAEQSRIHGDHAAARRAIRILTDQALPLAAQENPGWRARALYELAQITRNLGFGTGDEALISRASDLQRESSRLLEALPESSDPEDAAYMRALAKFNRAETDILLARQTEDESLMLAAVAQYDEALIVFTAQQARFMRGVTLHSKALALRLLYAATRSVAYLDDAELALRIALRELGPGNDYGVAAQIALGGVLFDRGLASGAVADLTEAATLFRKVKSDELKRINPARWAAAAEGLGGALQVRANATKSCPDASESLTVFVETKAVVSQFDAAAGVALLDRKIGLAQHMKGSFCR